MTFRVAAALGALAWALATAAAAQAPEPEEEPEPGMEAEEPEDAAPPLRADRADTGALPDRPVMVRVGASHTWDSNLFRAPQASSERIRVAYAGLSVNQPYAQQRFRLDITETAYRYENFSHLDFNGLSYLGAWEWRLGPRIGGALRATREESLADYSEFRNPGQQNIRTSENFALGADAWVFGGWHVTGGLTGVRNRYSVPFPQEGSYRASGGEAGVKWVAPSANWLAFNLRSLDGRYLDRALDPVARLDDGFTRREAEATTSWRMTGKSTIDGRVAHVDYRSDHFAERDFSGIAARARYLWQTTARLAFSLSLAREIEPWSETGASYRLEERLTLGSAWQPAARTTLRLEVTRGESEFRNPLPGFTGAERRDSQKGVLFEAEWRALRSLALKVSAQRYRQSSNDPAANFDGSQLAAGASFLF